MNSQLTPVNNRYARKQRRNPENWKRNVAKRMRYSAKSVPERVCDHATKSFQCNSLSMANLMALHTKFYSYKNKNDQDSIILNSCSINNTNKGANYKGRKQTATKYSVLIKNKRIPICKNFFLSIYGITKHRVSYVMNRFHYAGDVVIDERRGGNHKEKKYGPQRESIHKFIQTLKCVEAHYCRRTKTAERKYLSSDLNIRKLYDLYRSSECYISGVKKSYFRSVFNSNYNIGFGSPKTDVCSTCLELTEKIKNENDSGKKNILLTEKRVHKLRSKAFFEKLRYVPEGTKLISFDLQKNLPLPKLPDQMSYYTRQLYFYNLTMVEGSSLLPLTKNRVFAYYCTENEYNKDSNLVASSVFHRLSNTDLIGIKYVRLVADGCGGQNKNCILIGACSKWLLSNKNIESIELIFPVTGHSFMPADRQFGIIEKKMKKHEVFLHPDEIRNIIGETSTLVKLGVDCLVSDWRQAVKNIFKPTTTWPMAFKECKRFVLHRSKKLNNVVIRGEPFYKSDIATPVNVCRKNKYITMIDPSPMAMNIAVNKNKLVDINKLLTKHFGVDWRKLPTLSFYKELLLVQEQLTATSSPEDYCEEKLEESNDLRI